MGREVTASSPARCSVASGPRAWLFLALGSGRRFLRPVRNAQHTFSAHRLSLAACRRGVCRHRGSSPFGSRPQACCLTHRSSGQPPASHLAREALTVIIRLAGQAPSRRLPLSSNVRHQRVMPEVRLRRCAAMGREGTASKQARCPGLRPSLVLRVPPAIAEAQTTGLACKSPGRCSWFDSASIFPSCRAA